MKSNMTRYMAMCVGLLLAGGLMTSCNDWIREETPGKNTLEDFFSGGEMAIQAVNASYAPLQWEYNASFFSEWYIGDIASDDALKGGQNVSDGMDAYDIDNFKVNSSNPILDDYWKAKYYGIARCNLALQEIPGVDPDDTMSESRKECLIGEAYFLRALYYFQLVRVFGGVPVVDYVVDTSDKWKAPRESRETVYGHIIADLKEAEKRLWNKSEYSAADLGRATKGAAQAMLCKAYLYVNDYDNAYIWGKKFMDEQYATGQYRLNANYGDNFTLAGENGVESVFEVQYALEDTSDYGMFGSSRGTFTTKLVRPRSSSLGMQAGWGWNHPTQNLYDEFEPGDPRREATIGVPEGADLLQEDVNYLGNHYYNRKYAYEERGEFPALQHDSRGPLNYKMIRLSDVMLLYAEAALESGKDMGASRQMLENVRARARANSADPANTLPAFPGYNGYADNMESLRQAIRHERRVELAMEAHRWFDITRWGIAAEIMDKDRGSYGSKETAAARAEMANFIPGKNELFPIPIKEIHLNPMEQNSGY